MRKAAAVIILILWTSSSSYARGYGTGGAAVLKMEPSARAFAMGGAFISLCDDSDALYWNPAALPLVKRNSVTMMYHKSFSDVWFSSVNIAKPLGESAPDTDRGVAQIIDGRRYYRKVLPRSAPAGAVGVGFSFLDGGTIVSNPGLVTYRVQSDYLLSLGYGRSIARGQNHDLLCGISVKAGYLTLLERYHAVVNAFDIGILYRSGNSENAWHMACVVQNAGPGVTFDEHKDHLPILVRAGLARQYNISETLDGATSLECFTYGETFERMALKLGRKESDLKVLLGTEMWYHKILALRFGIRSGYDVGFLSAGFGVRYSILGLDYGFQWNNLMSNQHKVTLHCVF